MNDIKQINEDIEYLQRVVFYYVSVPEVNDYEGCWKDGDGEIVVLKNLDVGRLWAIKCTIEKHLSQYKQRCKQHTLYKKKIVDPAKQKLREVEEAIRQHPLMNNRGFTA